jgi:hypothetical protein
MAVELIRYGLAKIGLRHFEDMNDRTPEYLQGNIEGWQKKAAEFPNSGEDAWASDYPRRLSDFPLISR